ncbi:type II toxin-antitoxin system RelB/DinJ family antitoxin [Lactobacillus acetotolerans]|jgi:DNA-damage-inducible protein J|uniref:type II toxin-antitoxin system RelB/DinJ family antitoxin n=1 Tax=Lactobacillus acetotolerans TaxID=1600 RepID=UPI0007BA89D5|nr:type II toxin-antitoxin system RelB/DinJ family antitoxin [Lactobacillus acetotolerans]QGV04028.1 RelB [Lactobacillus acetotolerans]HBG91371.1 RelB [Lactobacillus acetotolerans]HBQ43118.1 RelB [Lactobacillus acetotolerans]
MCNSTIKDKTVSTRVTSDIDKRAKASLAKQGLTISEYMRLSLVKAANNEVQLVNFLDSPEALKVKKEAESGEVTNIGSLKDFKNWIDHLNAD